MQSSGKKSVCVKNPTPQGKQVRCTALDKPTHGFTLLTDNRSQPFPPFHLGGCVGPFASANSNHGHRFLFGSAVGAAAATAIHLAQIEAQAQLALQQLTAIAAVSASNHDNRIFPAASVPSHLTLLNLLKKQNVTSVTTSSIRSSPQYTTTMYGHHHSQPQGAHQPFSNQPRQQQGRSSADVLSQVLGFQVNQFPPRTQLPEELESALAIRGSRAEDRSYPGQMGRQNQHLPPMMDMHSGGGGRRDGQPSTEQGLFSPGSALLTSDNQPGHQQGVDWSKYQAPSKLFASSQTQHRHHLASPPSQQPPHNSNPGSGQPWNPSVPEQSSLHQQPRGGRGGIDLHGLYVPESAGSILASFGLSNEDLEVLSHYPDDQLTPDTLPFILRDIQINKAENKNTISSPSSSSFSQSVRLDHDVRPMHSRSPDVPSLLSVTQTSGKVIDYGHASRATDDSGRETFKREQLPKERTIKTDYKSSSASKHKSESSERCDASMQMAKSNKYGDLDYRSGSNAHKRSRSPVRKPPALPGPTSRLDRDYRYKSPKSNPSSEPRSESASSKLSRSAASASVSSSKSKTPQTTPTPTMISDFVAEPPKIFPHTCSLCHVQCDMAKDWVDHLNTVNHTASCRDLRNRYPDWKPPPLQKAPLSAQDGGSKGPLKDRSPSRSVSRSLSWSQSPSPPDRQKSAPSSSEKPQPNPRRNDARPHPNPPGQSRGAGLHHGGRTSPSHSHRESSTSYSSQLAEKRTRETSRSSSRDTKRPIAALSKPGPHSHPKPETSPCSANGAPKPETSSPSSTKGASKPLSNSKASSSKATTVKDPEEKDAGPQTTPDIVKSDRSTTKSNPIIDVPINEVPSSTEPETINNQNNQEGLVLITGLTVDHWSESDIIKLAQPFGTPSDIIMSVGTGKALVSVADMQAAEDMVKARFLLPAETQDSELKMTIVKQPISLRTPVALYNVLQGTSDPLVAPVSWSSLLVVQNVPSTPTGPTEVKKLVQRFGAVRNALCLSHNMIIFEMAASSIALAVLKRFQKYPCIIQNNSLTFSRQADPKISTNSKILPASLDSNSKDIQKAKDPKHQASNNGKEEQSEKKETHKESTNGDEQEIPDFASVSGRPEESVSAQLVATGHGTEPEADNPATGPVHRQTGETSDPESNAKSRTQQTEAMDTSTETTEDCVPVSQTGPPEVTPEDSAVIVESSKVVPETPKVTAEAPKITPEILKALLEECRSRSISRAEQSKTAAAPTGQNTQSIGQQGSDEGREKKGGSRTKPENERQNQKKDDKERNGGKEGQEKEIESAKREKGKNDLVERHERCKMDAVRRERDSRQSHRERSSISPYSGRSEVTSESSRKEEEPMQTTADEDNKEEDCEDSMPYDMDGFVTVDEVGDVEGLPTACLLSQTHGNGTSPIPEDTLSSVFEAATPAQVPTPVQVTPLLRSSTPDLTSEGTVGSLSPGAPPTTAPGVQITPESSPALAPGPEAKETTPETKPLFGQPTAIEFNPEKDESSMVSEETGETAKGDEEDKQELLLEAVEEHAVKTPMEAEEVQAEQNMVTVEEAGTEEEEEDDGSTGTGVLKRLRSLTEEHEDEVERAKRQKTRPGGDYVLPPFDSHNPVGMEFLLPKTGFFCKACSRFYTGGLEAKRNHCKSLKHYQSLQKYLGLEDPTETTEVCGAKET